MKKRGIQIILVAQEFEMETLEGKENQVLIGAPIFLASTFSSKVGQKALDCFRISGDDTFQKEKFVPILQEELDKQNSEQVKSLLDLVEI